MEPSYDAEAVKAKRQKRIARTRVAAAVASGVTFGAAVGGFALHDRSSSNATNVRSTTPTTTLGQQNNDPFANGNTFGGGATPAQPGGGFDTRSHGS